MYASVTKRVGLGFRIRRRILESTAKSGYAVDHTRLRPARLSAARAAGPIWLRALRPGCRFPCNLSPAKSRGAPLEGLDPVLRAVNLPAPGDRSGRRTAGRFSRHRSRSHPEQGRRVRGHRRWAARLLEGRAEPLSGLPGDPEAPERVKPASTGPSTVSRARSDAERACHFGPVSQRVRTRYVPLRACGIPLVQPRAGSPVHSLTTRR